MNATEMPNKMTGGELTSHLREEFYTLRTLIQKEPDVGQLIALSPLKGGRWAYLVQTTFATFPKFVMGTTDGENNATIILARSATDWGIRDDYKNLTQSVV